jgi:hypothetical protein
MFRWTLFLALVLLSLVNEASFAGTIQLPQTGQTTCYNSTGIAISCPGTGQDGEKRVGVAWPDPRFTPSGDCVTDNLTGLMWARNANLPNGYRNWQEALDYVASLNSGEGLCGHHDWRLPNVNELESLFNADYGNSAIWLTTQGFTNVMFSYWSSTSCADFTGLAFTVFMSSGHAYGNNKGDRFYYVWPVRSEPSPPAQLWKTGQTNCHNSSGVVISCIGTGQDGEIQSGVPWPYPRFTRAGDCVTDNLTGLMWARNANLPNGYRNWQEALDYVASLNSGEGLCGHHDWRLPNRKELRSLIDYSQYSPALPFNHPFTNVQPDDYWSSTSDGLNTRYASIVSVWDGNVFYDDKIIVHLFRIYVWPVRTGQVFTPTAWIYLPLISR